jgi:hypothetical protein
VIARLLKHPDRWFADQQAWNAHLDELGISVLKVNPDPSKPHIRLRYFCSPHHLDSALYPSIAAAGFRRDDTDNQRLNKLEAVLAQGTNDLSEAVPCSPTCCQSRPTTATHRSTSRHRRERRAFQREHHRAGRLEDAGRCYASALEIAAWGAVLASGSFVVL